MPDPMHARVRLRRLTAAVAALTAAILPVALSAPPADAAASPPPVTLLTAPTQASHSDIFITPTGDSTQYANGPEILDPRGNVVWFHPIPQGQSAADFRVQRYRGRPVLTWWQGTGLGGLAHGTDYIYNDRYQPIATVNAGNGLSADGHEFLITPQNTALILAYTTATADLTSIGGPADQTVIDGVVQEIDIHTGRVLFEWDSADHVPYGQSEQPLPASAATPWDWFHINAVHLDTDGNLLVDARNTWTTYKVNRRSGHIIWQLGGKASSFTLSAAPGQSLNAAGDIFAWQHDPSALGHSEYTFFDNESAGVANTGAGATSELGFSRAVRVRLDERRRTATLEQSYDQPEALTAPSQGNAQTTAQGDLFVGWGSLPYFSEFSRSGQLLLNAQFPTGVNSYRAYAFPWPASERSWGRHDQRGRRDQRGRGD